MAKSLLLDKSFLKPLVTLSLPIAMQNLINTTLNAIDSVMIGSLGSDAIAAVGFANQIFMILSTMLFGVCTACCIFISQFYGKQDGENIKKSVALNLVGVILFSTIFTILVALFPRNLMRFFTTDTDVIRLSCDYLVVIVISYIPMAISFALSSSMRAITKSHIPLLVSVIAIFINSFFNYMFIFGKFGAPALGVRGAAIGTVIARGFEFVTLVTITYTRLEQIQAKFRHLLAVTPEFLKKFLKTTAPVIINESMWSIGTAAYSAIFGRLSTDAVAAINITKVLENMLLVFFQGVGSAAGIMVGRKIGEGNNHDAMRYARAFTFLVPVSCVAISGVMLLLRPAFLSVYHVDASIKLLTAQLIVITACVMPFKALNYVHIVGTLRSGGDTVVCLLMDVMGVWLISLPLSFVTGIVLGMDIRVVYFCSLAEEIVKSFIVLFRLRNQNWIKNLVHDM